MANLNARLANDAAKSLERKSLNVEGGAPKRIRTSDLCLRRAALYPAELWVRETGA